MSCLSFWGPLVNRILVDPPENTETVTKAQPGPPGVSTLQEDGMVTKEPQGEGTQEPSGPTSTNSVHLPFGMRTLQKAVC